MLFFPETPVLRFALSPYYRQFSLKHFSPASHIEILNFLSKYDHLVDTRHSRVTVILMLVFNSFIWIPSFIFAADLGHFKCFRNSCLQLDVFSDESLEFFQNRFFCRTSHSCCDRNTFTNSENILFRESIYKRFGFQLYYKNASITCCPNNLAKLLTLSWHGLRYERVKIRCIKHLRMITFGVVQAG